MKSSCRPLLGIFFYKNNSVKIFYEKILLKDSRQSCKDCHFHYQEFILLFLFSGKFIYLFSSLIEKWSLNK